jgi:ankyrin repeat protein
MNRFKSQFDDMTSEYLLQRRALGDELDDEAHQAIEMIFAERGEFLPPRPSKPIFSEETTGESSKAAKNVQLGVTVFLALIAGAVGKAIAHTWVGWLVTATLIAYGLYKWLRTDTNGTTTQTPEQLEEEAKAKGLNDVTLAAAAGDLSRLTELIQYGQDVNRPGPAGTTALMYAARNNRADCIRLLINAGADPSAKSDAGSTAMSIAEKFGDAEAAVALRELRKQQS